MSHRFTREQLYDLVWSEPMPKLAPRFGVSDADLADTSREAIIQRPLPLGGSRAKSTAPGRRRQSRGLVSYFCSHFAPITPRNRVERDEERRIIRQRGTACWRTPFLQDQRVTGHGRVVLITQRSLVQIQPPQPRNVAKPKGPSDSAPLALFDGL